MEIKQNIDFFFNDTWWTADVVKKKCEERKDNPNEWSFVCVCVGNLYSREVQVDGEQVTLQVQDTPGAEVTVPPSSNKAWWCHPVAIWDASGHAFLSKIFWDWKSHRKAQTWNEMVNCCETSKIKPMSSLTIVAFESMTYRVQVKGELILTLIMRMERTHPYFPTLRLAGPMRGRRGMSFTQNNFLPEMHGLYFLPIPT